MACIGQVRLTVLRSHSRDGSVFQTYQYPNRITCAVLSVRSYNTV